MQKQQMINSLTTMIDMVPVKATTPRALLKEIIELNTETEWLAWYERFQITYPRGINLLNAEYKVVNPKYRTWVLEVKGDGSNGDVEVSAVISGCHGHVSWGWDDPKSKVIVLSGCGTRSSCNYVDPRIIETAKIVAQEIVDQKNSEG